MTDLVLSGLVKHRAALVGELEATQAKARQPQADIAAVDAVIRQLDPDYPVDAIAAKHPRGPAPPLGGPDTGRTVLGILRDAGGPMAVAAITERGMLWGGAEGRGGERQPGTWAPTGGGTVRTPERTGRSVLRVLADALWHLAACLRSASWRAEGRRSAAPEGVEAATLRNPPGPDGERDQRHVAS